MQELKSLCSSLISLHPRRYPPRPYFLRVNEASIVGGCCSEIIGPFHPQNHWHHLQRPPSIWVSVNVCCIMCCPFTTTHTQSMLTISLARRLTSSFAKIEGGKSIDDFIRSVLIICILCRIVNRHQISLILACCHNRHDHVVLSPSITYHRSNLRG
jgi:hypothetical protein